MTIRQVRDLTQSSNFNHIEGFRKNVGFVTSLGNWVDLSQTSGHPITNFYATNPLESATLNFRNGVYHGENHSKGFKYLSNWLNLATSVNYANTSILLCDYLLYYPFIDGDSTDEQLMTNSVSLPRYETGKDVMAFVVSQGGYTGGGTFQVTYTNQDGVSGKQTPIITSNSVGLVGHIIHCKVTTAETASAFLPLASGDTGIRSIDSVTWLTPNGGIYAIVLAKVIAQNRIEAANYAHEKSFIKDHFNIPQVYNEAYLNFLLLPNASLTGTSYQGFLEFTQEA